MSNDGGDGRQSDVHGPREVLDAFREAIEAGDERAAEALATPSGWASSGDSAQRLYRQCVRKSLDPVPFDPVRVRGDRAVAGVDLSSADRPKPVARLFALMVRDDEGWRLEAATRIQPLAGLFLRGDLDALPKWDALPASEEAAAFAAGVLERLAAGDDLATALPGDRVSAEDVQRLATREGVVAEALGSVQIPSVDRHAVGYRFVAGDEDETLWWILERGEAGFQLRSVSLVPQIEALLRGVEVPWGPGEGEDPLEPAEPEVVSGDNVVELEAERKKREPAKPGPTPLEVALQAGLREAFGDYVASNLDEGSGQAEFQVDAEFLKEHGAAVLNRFFQSVAKSLVPEFRFEVPRAGSAVAPDAPESAGSEPVAAGGSEASPGVSARDEAGEPVEGAQSDRPDEAAQPGTEPATPGPTEPAGQADKTEVRMKIDFAGLLSGLLAKAVEAGAAPTVTPTVAPTAEAPETGPVPPDDESPTEE